MYEVHILMQLQQMYYSVFLQNHETKKTIDVFAITPKVLQAVTGYRLDYC